MSSELLKVTSHVGRDLLQSAQLFRHEHSVVWEYVANGLQYKDAGTNATVAVDVDPKAGRIRIRDNGRGMRFKDLEQYFQMHGENLDRKHGRPGRGLFGTGKSAAFGIANSLTLTTIREGKRSKVRLTRKDIESRPDGDEIPVKILEKELPDSAPNGTLVEVEEIFLKKLDIPSVIRHIERHIAHWPNATVLVNNHECEFAEPEVARELTFRTKGTEYEALLGDVHLQIKVAKGPLDEEFRGIAILSNGVWHETTMAGCDRKQFSEYLFGLIDVPALETFKSSAAPFDMSRSMKLNPRNEVVAEIIRFVGVHLEEVLRELESQDRERRRNEEQKKLREQGSKIAELINAHFDEWSAKLKNMVAKSGVGRDLLAEKDRELIDENTVVFGDELPAIVIDAERGPGPIPPPGPDDPDPRPIPPRVELHGDAQERLAEEGGTSKKKNRGGGFQVVFDNIGISEKRAKYSRESRTITVNLDHPRIVLEAKNISKASLGDDPNFMRMIYEIAFTEYAIVLAHELSTTRYFMDPQDALIEVRQTIDDLSKALAGSQS